MKILKSQERKKEIQTFPISELVHIKRKPLQSLLNGEGLKQPIEVLKHEVSRTPRMGVGDQPYIEKKYSVWKGSQRVEAAIALGYTHIEGIIVKR